MRGLLLRLVDGERSVGFYISASGMWDKSLICPDKSATCPTKESKQRFRSPHQLNGHPPRIMEKAHLIAARGRVHFPSAGRAGVQQALAIALHRSRHKRGVQNQRIHGSVIRDWRLGMGV